MIFLDWGGIRLIRFDLKHGFDYISISSCVGASNFSILGEEGRGGEREGGDLFGKMFLIIDLVAEIFNLEYHL